MMSKEKKPKAAKTLMARKRAWWGRLFIAAMGAGYPLLFLLPMIKTFWYSLNKMGVASGQLNFQFVGLDNYIYYFTKDPNFVQKLTESLKSLVFNIPLIICFSMLVAIVLSGRFRGRTFFRAVFFFPVIIASGVVIEILTTNLMMSTSGVSDTQPAYMFQAPDLNVMFASLGVPDQVLEFISVLINQVFDLTWKSGVQILLLLAALGGIPASSYEVADIEGATVWEKFWKITLPMVLPSLSVSVVYTIIDSFTDVGNSVMAMIEENFKNGRYENASAIGVVYFICIMLIVLLVNKVLFRKVHYAVD